MSKFENDVRARLPEPGEFADGEPVLLNLRHTLAAYPTNDNSAFAIVATSGIYGPDGYRTGLTWGDLREILRRLELVEKHLAPNWEAMKD